MGIQLTKGQDDAVNKLIKWWNSQSKQVFEISGYAGTGKSTIVNILMERINMDKKNVAFVTFTGKASLVLTMKGVPATTIHKRIYKIEEYYEEVLDENGKPKYDDDGFIIRRLKTKFVKVDSLDPSIQLIVADECSMISQDMWDDLLSYNVPIIVLGDPGQLPPIKGTNTLLENPDVLLTEVMRQAADNPIIYLSMLARQGKYIEKKRYGTHCLVMNKSEITDNMYQRADIVLCGTNKTRRELNSYIRNLNGFTGDLPQKGDKLICRKNNWSEELEDYPLINGMIGYLHNDIDKEEIKTYADTFKIDFRPEFIVDNYFEQIETSLTPFISKDYDLKKLKYAPNLFEFGNAITTHLSQGSSWNKVVMYHEEFGDRDLRRKMLYTGITRAENLLVLGM